MAYHSILGCFVVVFLASAVNKYIHKGIHSIAVIVRIYNRLFEGENY